MGGVTPAVCLALLGGFDARLASGETVVVPRRKAAALLAYLACHPGQAQPRGKLAALLWPETAETASRNSLRQALAELRRALAKSAVRCVVADDESLSLDPASVESDVGRFRALIATGTPADLAQAAEIYRGDLLAGIAVDEPPFEEWLRDERERLREQAIEALAKLVGFQRAAGADEAALQTALRLAALDPLEESIHRTLMHLYAALGRRTAALRQYQACVTTLQRELGMEPDPATQRLYRSIVRQRPRTTGVAEATRVTDALPRDLPLVGRQAELRELRDALARMQEERGHLVAVLGEAGIGKSRLIAEFCAEATTVADVLVGRCYEAEQVLPFAPWVDVLRAAPLTDDVLADLGPLYRRELTRLLPELARPGAEPEPGPADHRQLFESIARVVRRLAQDRPLVVVLEDLHWADEMSVRLLAVLVRRLRGTPWLSVCSARDDELASAPMVHRTLDDLRDEGASLSLVPLSRTDTLALVRALAGSGERATTDLIDAVWLLSEGNPFVIVESVRALARDMAPGPLSKIPVPQRVREVITRHVERLSRPARALAGVAAVIGREFEFALVRRALDIDEVEAAEHVEELVRRRLLHSLGERLDFTHDRIRDVLYTSLSPELRGALHGRVVEAMEELYADRLVDHVERLAHHAVRGGLRDKAIRYLAHAGVKASRQSAHADALSFFRHALELLETLAPGEQRDRQEMEVRLALGPTLQVARGLAAADVKENYERARTLTVAVGGLAEQFQALWGLWLLSSHRADAQSALGLGRELLHVATRAGDPALLLEAHHAMWPVLIWLGDAAAAGPHLEQGRLLYDRARHRGHAFVYGGHDPGVCAHKCASWAYWILGFPARALEESAASLRLAGEIAHPPTVAFALAWASIFRDLRRDPEAAAAHARALIDVSSAQGVPQWLAAGMIVDASVRAERGEGEPAIGQIEQGLAAYESTGARLFRPYFLSLLARARARLGQFQEALRIIGDALTCARDTGELVWEPELVRLEGEWRLALAPDDVGGAVRCFRRAIDLARAHQARAWELRAAVSLARLLDSREPDEARRQLAAVYGWFTEGFDTSDLQDASALLQRAPQ